MFPGLLPDVRRCAPDTIDQLFVVLDGFHVIRSADALLAEAFLLEGHEVEIRPEGPYRQTLTVFLDHLHVDGTGTVNSNTEATGWNAFGVLKMTFDDFHIERSNRGAEPSQTSSTIPSWADVTKGSSFLLNVSSSMCVSTRLLHLSRGMYPLIFS